MDAADTWDNLRITSPTPTLSKVSDVELPTLSLHDVTYVVKERVGSWWKGACLRQTRYKTVLRNISMPLHGGQITAILGNSGSGKTSLLDVVACRVAGSVSGRVLFRHTPVTSTLMRRYASYVMQADRLLPNLTVRETLRYTAHLKLAAHTSHADVEEKVQGVIIDMGLRHIADTRIGGAINRGISGGEKRRVTIAIQLLQNPEVLLLDEPTTGLDSYTARYLVQSLADLAHRGKLVLLTLHQPRSDIFRMLDAVAILSLGQLTFFGQAGQLVPYFTSIGYPCPQYTNPLDKYVDVTSVDRRDGRREEESTRRVAALVRQYTESDLALVQRELLQKACSDSKESSLYRVPRGASSPRIMATLMSRMNLNLYRDRTAFVSRILLLPFFVFFILIFLGRLKHNQASIQDRIGLLYQSVGVPPYVGIINAVATFPTYRELFYREGRDGLYSVTSFVLAYTLHVIPFHVACTFIFSTVVYWVTGMQDDWQLFGMYAGVVFLLHFLWELVTVALMGLLRNPAVAQSASALICSSSVLVSSGFIRTLPSLPDGLQWVSWGLVHKYAGEILAANEFHNLNFTCDGASSQEPCLTSGDLYLQIFFPGVRDHILRNYQVLVAFFAGIVVFAVAAFKVRGIPNLQ